VPRNMSGWVNGYPNVCTAMVVNAGFWWESQCGASFFVPEGGTYKLDNDAGCVNIYWALCQY